MAAVVQEFAGRFPELTILGKTKGNSLFDQPVLGAAMWILFLVIFAVVLLYVLGARWACETPFDETHFIPVEGGRHVALHRMKPRSEKRRRHPALLCHGLGANRYNLALPGRNSIAELLARDGYDVFCMELSGFGMSVPQSWAAPGRYDVTLDDFILRDGPAAVDRILAETGTSELFWVGHSMGGLIAYALAQGPVAKKIRGVVTISSPAAFEHVTAFSTWAKFGFLLKSLPRLNLGLYARILVPILHLIPRRLVLPIIDPQNTDPAMLKFAAANCPSTLPSTLLRQFIGWMKGGRVLGRNGLDYQEGLKTVDRPILIISGGGDRLVPPSSVEYAYHHISSADKTYRCFGKAFGGSSDYGHGDIIVGRAVPDEIHPVIVEWMAARD